MSTQQQILYITEKQGPLAIRPGPIYSPGPGQILIRLKATGLNQADWKLHQSGSVVTKFPGILGFDLAGDVEEVGEGVTDFKKGDRVLTEARFVENEYMGFQQYALADAVFSTKIPNTMTYDEAATIPVGIATAATGLFAEFPHGAGLEAPFNPENEGKYAGTPLLVLGGASSVGQAVIQLAKISGFSPIIATASLENMEFLKSLGATHILDRSLDIDALRSSIHPLTGGNDVAVVFDTIGASTTESAGLSLVSKTGTLATVQPERAATIKNPNRKVARALGAAVAFGVPVEYNTQLFQKLFHESLPVWLEKGLFKPNKVEVLPNGLEAVAPGLERMSKTGVSCCKLIVRPHDTP